MFFLMLQSVPLPLLQVNFSQFFLFYVTAKLRASYSECIRPKDYISSLEPPPTMFGNEVSQNRSSLESAKLSSFFYFTTISSLFILLTNLFALLASSTVGLLIFLSKSQHSKRISGLVCVANQLN